MEGLVSDRMVLYFVEDSSIFLLSEVEVYDVSIRSVGKRFEILCTYSEKYILHSLTIQVAWYETFFPDAFYGCLVSDLADLAFKFNVFHDKIKMCYSETALAASPLHQKAPCFFMGLQIYEFFDNYLQIFEIFIAEGRITARDRWRRSMPGSCSTCRDSRSRFREGMN